MPCIRYCFYCDKRVRPNGGTRYVVKGKEVYLCGNCRKECIEAWLWHQASMEKTDTYYG